MFADEAQVLDHEKRISMIESMGEGRGIRILKSPGGITICGDGKASEGAKSQLSARTSSGGLIELHREWSASIRAWRLNERVVYKPGGSTYHLIYQCNDATATTTDVPGISGKWTKITVWNGEAYWAKATTYTTGQKVLYLGGIYTAVNGSQRVVPGTNNGKWTFTADSLIGVTSYPLQIDGADVWTPVAWYEQYDTRYETTADPAINKLYFGQRRITRGLDGSMRVSVVGDMIEWATAVPHTGG